MNLPRPVSPGFTLIEVLVVTTLLAFFLVAFYEGSQRMAIATIAQQNRTEALLQGRRIGERWRAGTTISAITRSYFLNGTAYTVSQVTSTYGANSSLRQLALTLGWKEPNPNSITPLSKSVKDVYFKY